MPRAMQVEYLGVIYHAMNCGDRRKDIFANDVDHRSCFRLGGMPEDGLADSQTREGRRIMRTARIPIYGLIPLSFLRL